MTMTVTNNDIGSVILQEAEFRDETLTFDSASTALEGTILARKSVDDAVTVVDGSNTGTGTTTLATVVAGDFVPVAGDYVLTVTAAVTHGGVLQLVDPNGAIVASGLSMTASTGAATVFEVAGLQFTVTDGGTDFAVGDSFTLTVVANGKMVVFSKTGAGGAQIPTQILTYAVTATAAGDVAIRSGVSGKYRKERLVISADGDASNVDSAVIDQLRNYGLVSVDVQELNILDNQ